MTAHDWRREEQMTAVVRAAGFEIVVVFAIIVVLAWHLLVRRRA